MDRSLPVLGLLELHVSAGVEVGQLKWSTLGDWWIQMVSCWLLAGEVLVDLWDVELARAIDRNNQLFLSVPSYFLVC